MHICFSLFRIVTFIYSTNKLNVSYRFAASCFCSLLNHSVTYNTYNARQIGHIDLWIPARRGTRQGCFVIFFSICASVREISVRMYHFHNLVIHFLSYFNHFSASFRQAILIIYSILESQLLPYCGDLATPMTDGQTSWVYCTTLVQYTPCILYKLLCIQ